MPPKNKPTRKSPPGVQYSDAERRARGEHVYTCRLRPEDVQRVEGLRLPGETDGGLVRRAFLALENACKTRGSKKSDAKAK